MPVEGLLGLARPALIGEHAEHGRARTGQRRRLRPLAPDLVQELPNLGEKARGRRFQVVQDEVAHSADPTFATT